MGEIIPVIQAILNGAKSPIKAGVGALLALLFYFFVMVQKGVLRDKKAESEKNDQKGESNIDLEDKNSEADTKIRDRLEQRD